MSNNLEEMETLVDEFYCDVDTLRLLLENPVDEVGDFCGLVDCSQEVLQKVNLTFMRMVNLKKSLPNIDEVA